MVGCTGNRGVVTGVGGHHAGHDRVEHGVDEGIALFDVFRTRRHTDRVHPGDAAFLRHGVLPGGVFAVEQKAGGVPGLADLGAGLLEGVGSLGGVVPERSDVLLAVDDELGAGIPYALGIVFRLVDVHHPVGLEFADGVEIEADAHDHRLLAEGSLAFGVRRPQRPERHFAQGHVLRVVGDGLGAPVERQQHALAAVGGAQLHRVAVHGFDQVGDVGLALVDRLQQVIRVVVVAIGHRREDHVEALAAGGLQLLFSFVIGAIGRKIHLDAGVLLELVDHVLLNVVAPGEHVDLAR